MFAPESVAVIGATERPGSVGRALLENLKSYRAPVYPVNRKRHRVLGVPAFPEVGAIPDHVELAIVATPAATVPDVVEECAAAGVTGAVVVSAGFRECGPVGAKLEGAIAARRGQMRIVGPNCFGVMIPRLSLNATFAPLLAKDGHLAFVSQSGALCSSVLGVEQAVVSPAAISITATPAWCSCPDRTAHARLRRPDAIDNGST